MAQSNNEAEKAELHDQPFAPKGQDVVTAGPAAGPPPVSGEGEIDGSSSTQHQPTNTSDEEHGELTSTEDVAGESSTNALQQNIEAEDVSRLDLSCVSTENK